MRAPTTLTTITLLLALAGSVSAGLVAHYEFEGNAQDSAGSNHGTHVGNPTYTAGVYGQGVDNKQDVYTMGSVVGVCVNKKMDDATAYRLTRLFWEQAKNNIKTHPWLRHLSLTYAVRGGGRPLHPGAAKYYRERGIKIPAGSL